MPRRIAYPGWYSNLFVIFVPLSKRVKARINIDAELSNLIKLINQFLGHWVVRPWHHTPHVPWQHLHVIQCSEIAQEVLRNEPVAAFFEDSARCWVELGAAAGLPSLSSAKKFSRWLIEDCRSRDGATTPELNQFGNQKKPNGLDFDIRQSNDLSPCPVPKPQRARAGVPWERRTATARTA